MATSQLRPSVSKNDALIAHIVKQLCIKVTGLNNGRYLRNSFVGIGWLDKWDQTCGVTKLRTDRTDRTGGEIAAGKAQINYRDLVINLYTAYHSIHDEFSQKFYRKKFTEDRQIYPPPEETTKHRTDRTGQESAAGKAQINCRDPLICTLP